MAIELARGIESGGPRQYLNTGKKLFCKRDADPTSTKIVQVKSFAGAEISCTGRRWTGPSGGIWAELHPDGGQHGWALVQGPGFGLTGPALVDPDTLSEKEEVALLSGIAKDGGEDWPTNPRSDEEWEESLPAAVYACLRGKVTEPAGTGEYNKFFPTSGHFVCAGCNAPLYSVGSKFDSRCGWPAFDKCFMDSLGRPRVVVQVDWDAGGREILCRACGGHLGHVFMDGNSTGGNTLERHCTNSVAIVYREEPAPPGRDDRPPEEGLLDHGPFHRQLKAQVDRGVYSNV